VIAPALRRAAATAAATGLLLALAAAPALAHARLLAANPADGATVDSAPVEVVLRFSEEVSTDFAVVQVTAPDGSRVDADTPAVVGDHVYARLLPLTQPGAYTVSYRVVSADSHPIEGTTTFTLAEGAVAAPEEPAPATEEAAPQPAPTSAPEAPSEPAPEPTREPEETASAPATELAPMPTEAATELAAARDDPPSGSSPWPLLVAVVVLVALAAGGFLATRRRDDSGASPSEPAAPDGAA